MFQLFALALDKLLLYLLIMKIMLTAQCHGQRKMTPSVFRWVPYKLRFHSAVLSATRHKLSWGHKGWQSGLQPGTISICSHFSIVDDGTQRNHILSCVGGSCCSEDSGNNLVVCDGSANNTAWKLWGWKVVCFPSELKMCATFQADIQYFYQDN